MDICRITAVWSGFIGAPGYSVFHFTTDGGFWDGGLIGDSAQAAAERAAADVGTAFGQLSSWLPPVVQIRTQPEAEIINSDTGEIVGFTEVPTYSTDGEGPGNGYSAASGAVVNWRTNDYRFGRRIRGRTFVVPLSGAAYEDDGTLVQGARDKLLDFADRIVDGGAAAEFGVWSRPRGGTGGVFATATGYSVPDMAAVLRSRRD